MSLRQAQKQLAKTKQQEELDYEELQKDLKDYDKPKKATFAAFQMSESEEDEENQENDQQNDQATQQSQQEQKKKKNRGKKSKKPKDETQEGQTEQKKVEVKAQPAKRGKGKEEDDDAYLEKIIKQNKEESKRLQSMGQHSGLDSILKMDKKDFNYKRELKHLFQKSAQAYGAGGVVEDEKEERKEQRTGAGDYEGYSKKQKRRLKMMERLQEKNKVLMAKKYLLVQPDSQWPRVEKLLTMEQVRTDRKTGSKVFSYVKTPEYVSLQKEFEQVQSSNDIQYLMEFLRKNFYHHESLLYFADFLRMQGKFSDSCHFLERCLFAFESAWTFDFQPVPPEKHDTENFVPQTKIDLDREHLNKVFCECLVKYIDIIGRKGCSRTSLEYCKLLLSLAPETDPYGTLLRMDYYADRAREYEYLKKLIKVLPDEIYPEETMTSLLVLPNLLMTTSLAEYELKGGEARSQLSLDQTLEELLNMDKHLNQLLDLAPEALLITAVMLYPGLIEAVIKKSAQKQINAAIKKSHFQGYQAKNWTELLKHQIFTEELQNEGETHEYEWMLTNEEKQLPEKKQHELIEETLSKLYQIFVARSSALFNPDHILLWMKEVIGFTLNKLDDGTLDRQLFQAKIASLTQVPFALSRYRTLRVGDFSDDVTTINPNELMMAGGGQQQQHDPGMQAEANMAAQQLQHMINQLNRPQAQHAPLIQQQNMDNMNEQELIAMQEAILAQIGQEEHLNFDDEDSGDEQPGNQGGGLLNYVAGLFPNWGGQQQNEENKREEDKKQE